MFGKVSAAPLRTKKKKVETDIKALIAPRMCQQKYMLIAFRGGERGEGGGV